MTYTEYNLLNLLRFLKVAGKRIAIFAGSDAMTFTNLEFGGSGGVIGVANVAPKLASSVFDFFPSRSRHAGCSRDWSSDVCSSDLIFSSCTAVAEQKNLQAWRRMEGQEGAISRVNCLAAAVLRHDLNLYDFPSHWRDRPPWLVVLGVRQIPGLAATDCLLCGSQEALDDLRQHRLDRERVVSGVRHDCELICGPQ